MLGRSIHLLRFISCAFACLVATTSASAAPGDFDATFGTRGGVAPTPSGPMAASAILLQADGKLVAIGPVAANQVALARFNANGTPDANFGNNGTVVTQIGSDGNELDPK